MARLIDADKLKAHYAWWADAGNADMRDDFDTIVDLQPTADTKDIFYDGYACCLIDFGKDTVLCKDCKHWNGETHGCNRNPCVEPWWETDFCNYGERKDEGEKCD